MSITRRYFLYSVSLSSACLFVTSCTDNQVTTSLSGAVESLTSEESSSWESHTSTSFGDIL